MKPIVPAVPVLVSVFAIALFAPPALAQKETKPPVIYPELPSDIPAKFKPVTDSFDYTRRSVMIPMRDGVKLHTVILIPKEAKKAPILLTRTPYSADKLTSHAESAHLGPVLHGYDNAVDVILKDGYIRVVQDVRGKHGSEGDYVVNRPLRGPLNKTPVDHATDTYDTIDWLVKNVPESNGKVGILGISYNGFLPLMALVHPHPALKVSVPMNPMVDGWIGDDWFHYGAFRQLNASWIYNQVATRKGDAKWWRSHYDEYDMWMQAVSAGELGRRRGLDQLGFWNKLVEHPAYDTFWRDQAIDKVLAEQPLKTPVMLVHSLWDQEDIYGAPAVYKAIKPKDTANDKVFLVIGPWHHGQMIGNGSSLGAVKFGSDTALYFRRKILAPFLAQYLKDGAAKADIAPVTAFETGTNEWRRYSAWPPKTDEGKTGKMTPLYLRASLKLSQTAPQPDEAAFEEYLSDPAKPVPFCPRPIQPMGYEDNNLWPRWLVNDQREASGRPDVVTFVSEVLTEPMKISGEPIANLVASTSGTDSDWVVKLIDVYPDEVGSDAVMGGYQLMIAADIFRGRYRESFAKAQPIASNTPLLYRFALPTANHVFLPGHRIMVQIQSSWFPLYDRNPQTFVPNIFWAKSGDYRKATQRIYHSGKERSFIELPLTAPTSSARPPTALEMDMFHATTGSAQEVTPKDLQEQARQFTRTAQMIPMRDGVKLYTTIYVPKEHKGPLPFLMHRTPYGIESRGPKALKDYLKDLANEGYIFVFQDIRGRHKSEGQFVMQRPPRDPKDLKAIDEGTDTNDTIDWLLKNVSNHNGRVGLLGISYPGWLTVMALLDPHPALKAASPQAPPADMFLGDDFHHNGAFRLSYGFEYVAMMETDKSNASFAFDRYDTFEWYLKLGALSNVNRRYFKDKMPTWNNFIAHPNYDDFWKKQASAAHLMRVSVPTLHVAGWFDQEDFYGPLKTYELLERHDRNDQNFLVVGPWNHGGWSSGPGDKLGKITFDSDTGKHFRARVQAPFFAHFLKDKGEKPPEALMFQTGSNQWVRHECWPPKTAVTRKLYFHPYGKLGFKAPAETKPTFDEYVSDPARPVPYRPRPITPTYPGPEWQVWMVEDQRFTQDRPDVLTYETEPLKEDVTVAGSLTAHLFAATSGSDSDWVVRLIDVYPEKVDKNPRLGGFQLLVSGEPMRARFRKSFEKPEPVVPGEVNEYRIDLHWSHHCFRKGHKIMVQVQSSWFPLIDRNPQKYVGNIFEARDDDFQSARQQVHHSPKYPSAISMQLLEK